MNIYGYTIYGRFNYKEVGLIKATSLEQAQSKLDEVLDNGPLTGEVRELNFDIYDMVEMYATN